MVRYSDNHPNISRPFHLSLGTIRPMSDDQWDFYLASVFGDVETLQNIHAKTPNIEATVHYEFPLIMAVRQGRADAVRFLLSTHHANVDGKLATKDNVWFSRCIDAANARGFSEIKTMLKEHRAKAEAIVASQGVHQTDETLKPPIQSGDLAALKTLLTNAPELTKVSRGDQMQTLLWAYGADAEESLKCEMLEMLIDHGIDPNCGPLIHYASEKNSIPIAKLLLEKGADPNTVVDSCSNCMWIAKFSNKDNYQEMHALLESFGGRIMLHDLDELPPVSELLAADQKTRDAAYPGGELLWAILREDNLPMLEKFVELYGMEQIKTVSPGGHWYDPRSTAMIDRLVEYGFDVNRRDWRGRSMIFLAPFDRFPDYIRHGADLNVVDFMECSTQLGYAAADNNLEMATFLLENNADPNLPTEHEWARPLSRAEKKGHGHMVELLEMHRAA